MSTMIQILVFSSNSASTFDERETALGRQWIMALNYLATCPDFFMAAWGPHLESPEHITLLIDWSTAVATQTFLTKYYDSFIPLLIPLLATAQPPSLPYTTNLAMNMVEPAAIGGGISTISKLEFASLSADNRFNLLPLTFHFYAQEIVAAALADGNSPAVGYKGGHAAWGVDGMTGEATTTLWTIVSWTSLEAEQRCEQTLQTSGRNLKEIRLGPMLEQADDDGVRKYHVAWTIFTPDVGVWC